LDFKYIEYMQVCQLTLTCVLLLQFYKKISTYL